MAIFFLVEPEGLKRLVKLHVFTTVPEKVLFSGSSVRSAVALRKRCFPLPTGAISVGHPREDAQGSRQTQDTDSTHRRYIHLIMKKLLRDSGRDGQIAKGDLFGRSHTLQYAIQFKDVGRATRVRVSSGCTLYRLDSR